MRELNRLVINDATRLPDMAHHAEYLKSELQELDEYRLNLQNKIEYRCNFISIVNGLT